MAATNGRTGPLLVVAAALTMPDGRVLIQRRRAGRHHAGRWEFPGGKVEPDETPPAALARELTEELGLAIDPADAHPLAFALGEDARGGPLVLLLFRVERWRGQARPIDADALEWVMPDGLARYPLAPADRVLARRL